MEFTIEFYIDRTIIVVSMLYTTQIIKHTTYHQFKKKAILYETYGQWCRVEYQTRKHVLPSCCHMCCN